MPSDSGDPHHQRHSCSDIEDGHLVPPPVFAKVIAMVSQENDHRIAPQLQTIHRIEQFPDLGIYECRACMVGPFEFAAILVREGFEVVGVGNRSTSRAGYGQLGSSVNFTSSRG